MGSIPLSSLNLVLFDENSIEHTDIKSELLHDPAFRTFIPKKKELFSSAKENGTSFHYDTPYLVREGNKIIGYLYTFSKDLDNIVDMYYAVVPEYRGRGLGNRLVKEASNYIFRDLDVEKIRLIIHNSRNKDNKLSRLVANRNQFYLIGTIHYYKDNPNKQR